MRRGKTGEIWVRLYREEVRQIVKGRTSGVESEGKWGGGAALDWQDYRGEGELDWTGATFPDFFPNARSPT